MPATSSTDNSPSFAYAPGDLIAAKYRLEQLLGEGGMGAVFRARNTSLDMQVAIKLLRADMNRGLLAGRLLQEARAAAKLAHPAIVRVFDVGQTALGDPFIVMELLEGESLATMIDRERGLAPIHAVQLLLPLADALSAAHAKGLVHRDFKPDNVMLIASDEGTVQPKLLDFGIVKSAQPDGSQGPSDAGSVVGSPDYMSPEQARGLEQVDARSDLWSFSVVLYEVMAGVPPFQANDYGSLLRMIVQDEPQTLKDRGVADHALSYIVSRGLSKDPMARYASVSQMGMALAAWLLDQGVAEDASGVSVEKKWLARASDPDIARKSWPPPRLEKVSGIRKLDITFNEVTSLSPLPPSSLAPTVDSSASARRAPSRSLLALGLVALVLLTLPLAWLIFGGRGGSPQHMTATPSANVPVQVVEMSPPTVATATASAAASVEAVEAPSAAEPPPAPSASAAPSVRRRAVPQKFRAAPSAAKQERLSEKLLSPLTF